MGLMADTIILGHSCRLLTKAQTYREEYGCIPRLSGLGTMEGCDATNQFIALFCPFCGEPFDLTEARKSRWVKQDEDGDLVDEL